MPSNLFLDPPNPLGYFESLVQSDTGFPLLEAAICLGQMQFPGLDVQGVLVQIDTWQQRLHERVPKDAAPMAKLMLLNQYFFKELGFGGNLNDYYAPDNSFVHHVVRARRGIPVSLAVVWLELAQGMGLDAAGVSFPGHFMVKVSLPTGQAVMDPMTGQSFGRDELVRMLQPYRPVEMGQDSDIPLGLYLQPAPSRDILVRMLRNLKEIYKSHRYGAQWLSVQERLVVLVPECWSEYRDRGLAHALLGQNAQALSDLECYSVYAHDAVDADAVGQQMELLRRQLAPASQHPARPPGRQ
jgi:regulator of sirC expression with transglutaminase-like and TPR domain